MEVFFIIYDFWNFWNFWNYWNYWNYELSLNLSRNRKMESKIKMESTIITNIQYSIKVYEFEMKRE